MDIETPPSTQMDTETHFVKLSSNNTTIMSKKELWSKKIVAEKSSTKLKKVEEKLDRLQK